MKLITENWQLITGAVASIFAYFGGIKMKSINEKKASSEALSSMQQAYNEFVLDQKERYNELKEELKYVREQTKHLQQDSLELRAEIKQWKSRYNSLKNEFNKYREKHK